MDQPRSLRLPLQTGDTAIRSLAIGVMCFGAALPFVTVFVARIESSSTVDVLVTLMESIYGLPLLVVAGAMFVRAYRASPSDIVFDKDRCEVIGGAIAEWAVRWEDVASCDVRNISSREGESEVEAAIHERDRALALVLKNGAVKPLAVAATKTEIDSFEALRLTIMALLAPVEEERSEDGPLRVRTIPCSACGAPLQPTHRPTATCPFCKAESTLPKEVAELVRANASAVKAESEVSRYVERARGGAPLDNVRRTMLALWIAAAVFVVGLAAEWHLFTAGRARVSALAFLLLAGILLVPALAMLGYGACIDRRAARFFSLGLSATPPSRPGEPQSCRACGASLPETDGAVAHCLYCKADNVLLGVDLRVRLSRDAKQKSSVKATTKQARHDRTAWMRRGRLWGAALLAITLALLVVTYARRPIAAIHGAHDLARVTWDPFETAKEPALSPDGKVVAFTQMRVLGKNTPAIPGLALVKASGGFSDLRMSQVGNIGVLEMPEWSLDGKKVHGINDSTLETANPARSDNAAQAWRDQHDASPRVRPKHDGQLALVRAGEITFDGKTFGPGAHPAWFADGESLAFTRGGQIWVARVTDPASPRALTHYPCPVDYAAPDADGTRIAFIASCHRDSAIVVQSLASDATSPLTQGHMTVSDLRWQGGWLLFTADDAIFRMRPP